MRGFREILSEPGVETVWRRKQSSWPYLAQGSGAERGAPGSGAGGGFVRVTSEAERRRICTLSKKHNLYMGWSILLGCVSPAELKEQEAHEQAIPFNMC